MRRDPTRTAFLDYFYLPAGFITTVALKLKHFNYSDPYNYHHIWFPDTSKCFFLYNSEDNAEKSRSMQGDYRRKTFQIQLLY